MVAVCPACDTVFRFGASPGGRIKRRKYKQPAGVTLSDTPQAVELSFPQRISADDRKGLFIGLGMATMLGGLSLLMFADDAPALLATVVLLFALIMANVAVAVLANRRQVRIDTETISTRQGPVPIFLPGEDWLFAEKTLPRQDVARVFCEQTEESRKSGQLTRYYHVCLGLPDDERVFLLKSLPQAHAFYVAQMLEEALLYEDDSPDDAAARLADDTPAIEPDLTAGDLRADGEFGRDIEG